MSATRDSSQKHAFVYSNLYHLYRKGKDAAESAHVPAAAPKVDSRQGIVTGKIIKADEMAPGRVGLKVTRHEPPALLGKRLGLNTGMEARRPARIDASRREAIEGLRSNLRSLQSLHERLRFMLKEIEDLSKE
jgi:hypothetical protein